MKGNFIAGLMAVKDTLGSLEYIHAGLRIQVPLGSVCVDEIVVAHHHKPGYDKSAAVKHRIRCCSRIDRRSSRGHMVAASGGVSFSDQAKQNLCIVLLEVFRSVINALSRLRLLRDVFDDTQPCNH